MVNGLCNVGTLLCGSGLFTGSVEAQGVVSNGTLDVTGDTSLADTDVSGTLTTDFLVSTTGTFSGLLKGDVLQAVGAISSGALATLASLSVAATTTLAGNIFATGNFYSSGVSNFRGAVLNSSFGLPFSIGQGMVLCWSNDGPPWSGTGCFINGPYGGTGGFRFMNCDAAGVILNTVLTLTRTGGTIVNTLGATVISCTSLAATSTVSCSALSTTGDIDCADLTCDSVLSAGPVEGTALTCTTITASSTIESGTHDITGGLSVTGNTALNVLSAERFKGKALHLDDFSGSTTENWDDLGSDCFIIGGSSGDFTLTIQVSSLPDTNIYILAITPVMGGAFTLNFVDGVVAKTFDLLSPSGYTVNATSHTGERKVKICWYKNNLKVSTFG